MVQLNPPTDAVDQGAVANSNTAAETVSASERVARQRDFFATGQTRSRQFREAQLQKLKQAIEAHEDAILSALHKDLGKPEFEGFATEVTAKNDVDYALKHLKRWMSPRRVSTPLTLKPGRAYQQPEPLGVTLIISPWNYPFQLGIVPLIGAIAAGNCAILKPSEISPHTSALLAKLLSDTFDPDHIAVVEGDAQTSQALLAQKFDHIFFTGSTHIGRIVMKAAAEHLTPLTLELGGKSPCIVDANINLEVTAKRIVWGKFINAGQTCIAPDYLLVDQRIKSDLLNQIKQTVTDFYGDNPQTSPDYGRIVSDRHFQRLTGLISGDVIVGGGHHDGDRYIAPTVIDGVTAEHPAMAEEIFGPILPVVAYDNLEEAIAFINARPRPLAAYIFSKDKAVQQQILQQTGSGGVCINDTIKQVAIPDLPFGGVGDSGMGAYHGQASFDTFSHLKGVFKRPFWLDLPLLYPPYGDKLNFLKKAL